MKSIGKRAFLECRESHLPGSAEELFGDLISLCEGLSCVTSDESSSSKGIENETLDRNSVLEIHIPDRLKDLVQRAVPSYVQIANP